jgi:hypothetical protein
MSYTTIKTALDKKELWERIKNYKFNDLVPGLVQEEIGVIHRAMVVVTAVVAAVVVVAVVINDYILSGTFMPSKPMADAITFAVNSQSFNLNCFFSSDSAFITECSV